ncbi:MAG: response regulator transcription factor [Sulfurimonas sp.]|jgi:DNA-binding NarL/FixJ family response regulator|nr:response regulator transcription factor [Sulfurimonas sp.]MBU1217406.1 LuxR C-terminal-related transcriptional regulator [bacterium]MBU1433939.1 LuxR C-terminal-related transcriptional regulator [bacterium]MBU1503637.1 LuxR C-terminal-related transcriptional regulator [bacterium]MBU3938741.1 LuxR C-terminal-related transcriptional regulator [bacterium]
MKIILHSDDINLLAHWQNAIKNDAVVFDTTDELLEIKSSIIIINFSACEPSCEELIKRLFANGNKVLLLHRTPSLATAKTLLKAGAMGYGNALMREHFILSAVHTLKENMVWLYPEFTSELITQIPATKNNNDEKLAELTVREKEVALLLKDGFSYKEIAENLDITTRTVKAHAQHTYAKLGIKDRLGLALLIK